jgi:hypothetical protein
MGMIKSIERFEVTLLTTEASKTATLTKGQVAANCVPFATFGPHGVAGTADPLNYASMTPNVAISGSTLTVDRTSSAFGMVAHVTVIEFDPVHVKVQIGTWTMSSVADALVNITAVNLSRAFIVFYGKRQTATSGMDRNMVSAIFNTATQLRFRRANATDVVPGGTFYVVEAISTPAAFTVTPFGGDFTNVGSLTITIPSVNLQESFLISSCHRAYTARFQNHCVWMRLASGTTVTASVNSPDVDTIFVHGFVVTVPFSRVLRSAISGSTFVGTVNEVTLSIGATVNPLRAMPWIPANHGCGNNTINVNNPNPHKNFTGALLATATTPFDRITLRRTESGSGSAQTAMAWEVVEWPIDLYTITGFTRNNIGEQLPDCPVYLFHFNFGTGVITHIATGISDSTGRYTFSVPTTAAEYFVVARKSGSPNIFDVTDFGLFGA